MILKVFGRTVLVYTIVLWILLFFGWTSTDVNTDFQIIPFDSIKHYLTDPQLFWSTFDHFLLQIIIFIPIGFLGISIPSLRKFKTLLKYSVVALILLEFSQWMNNDDYPDIDDFLLHFIGIVIGYGMFLFVVRFIYYKTFYQFSKKYFD